MDKGILGGEGMEEKLEVLDPQSRFIGRKCPRCEQEFAAGDEVVECPRCHMVHHAACWKENGGCARRGCPQVAKTVVGERRTGDGPPPPLNPKYVMLAVGVVIALIVLTIIWPKPSDPAAGRIKISVLLEASFDELTQLNQIVGEFNSTSDEIYIELQTTSLSMIENQLFTRMAAGEAPDIFSLPYDRFERIQEELGAMYPLGDGTNRFYGVQHPSQLRVLSIFVYTKHPDAAITVLRYLLEEMPRRDLAEFKAQAHIIDPERMMDIDTFLSLPY